MYFINLYKLTDTTGIGLHFYLENLDTQLDLSLLYLLRTLLFCLISGYLEDLIFQMIGTFYYSI